MGNRRVRKLKQELRYEWRGKDGHGVSAEVAGKELERIADRDGAIQPQVVVDESRPEDAPLHPAFEWDDEVAAERYRIHQARKLIKDVHVIKASPGGDDKPKAAYVHIPETASETIQRGYYKTEVVAQRPDLYALALDKMMQRMRSLQEAADDLKHAAEHQDVEGDTMAKVTVALAAISAANNAVMALH
jgi:hypothetical protein